MERHFPHYTRSLIPNARKLRKEMTNAERKLWSLVRSNQLGIKIRRQVPIGPYIVDFLCQKKRLVIELDGIQHHDRLAMNQDMARDDYLRTKGYTVLRFDNSDMLNHYDQVVTKIKSILESSEKPKEPDPEG